MVWLLSFTRFASLTKRIALIVAVEARLRVISPPVMTAATVANGRIGFGIIFVCANFFRGNFSNSWSAWRWFCRKPNLLSNPFGPGKRPTSSVAFDGWRGRLSIEKVIRRWGPTRESLLTDNFLLQQEEWPLWSVNNKNNSISVGSVDVKVILFKELIYFFIAK